MYPPFARRPTLPQRILVRISTCLFLDIALTVVPYDLGDRSFAMNVLNVDRNPNSESDRTSGKAGFPMKLQSGNKKRSRVEG